jgi:flagellar L-ring protein precursor FlgH
LTAAAVVAAAAAPAASGQSLWRNDGPYANFIRNTTAHNVGDILTVVIAEASNIQNTQQTKTDRTGSFAAAITNFDIAPNAFSTLPAFAADSNYQFDGQGDQTRQNLFESRIQVQVFDKLPNGNLLIVGTRTIRVDDESKTIEIRGVVRPIDVLPDNTIKSEQVANAEISYVGDGILTRATTKGFIAALFEEVFNFLWPF